LERTVQKVSAAQWRILILLVLSVWINYMDRANLSVAAPQLRVDLSLSPLQLGMLLSAFFWTYTALQPVAGWLVDRFNVGWVFAMGYFLWSVATGITGLVSGLEMLLVCRLILGLGESIAYPAYSNILANHFPQHRLALANALIDSGSKMWPALGTLLGALLVESLGWRVFFIALGLIGGTWLIPWAFWAPRSTTRLTKVMHSSASPSYFEIMRVRAIWGTSIAHFGGNYFWYFLITWLPTYLVEERGFSLQKTGFLGALPFVMIATSSIIAGWFSDRLIQYGRSVSKVRLSIAATGLAGSAIVILVPLLRTEWLAMVALCGAGLFYGLFSSNLWAITQTLAGPTAAGRWSGFQNCCGNLAGVVAPWLTGFVVSRTGEYYWAFVACCVVLAIGACSYIFVVRRVERIRWSTDII
jgi:ACS family D-galactonate transporter-like MFS transporter